jgi:ATP-binding cassette, subfamily B, multidrug efflux pump
MIKKTSEAYRHHPLAFTLGPALKMIEAVFDLMIPLIMKTVIDMSTFDGIRALDTETNPFIQAIAKLIESFGTWIPGNDNLNYAIIGGFIILLMGIFGFLTTMLTQYIAARTAMLVGTEVRNSLYEKILSFSKMEKEEFGNARLLTTLNADSYQVQQGVLIFIRLIVRAPFIILGALIISMVLNWQIGLIFIAIVPMILFVIFFIMRKSSKEYLSIQKKLDNISIKTSDTLEGSKVIRAFNRQDYEEKSFEQTTDVYMKNSIHVNFLNALINPLTFAIIALATLAVVLFGGLPMFSLDAATSRASSSTIITEVAYLTQIFTTLVQLTNVVMVLTKATVSKKRVDEILAVTPAIRDAETPIVKKDYPLNEEILSFKNVSIAYKKGGNLALKNCDFSLNKGQSLGIIGGTGSGKSTLINLMERFLDPSEGVIEYKKENLKNYSLEALRDEIALVPQKSVLFKGTLRSNMLMANPNATDEDIKTAMNYAMAYEFVSKYDDLLNHEVEEGGKNFSGGQRQRLCISRALVKKPEVIILDDSTSALDLLTDKKVRQNIAENYHGITKVIVSQRVSTVSDCDLILVLEGGNIVGKGNHKYLMENCPVYKETYLSQVQKGGE